MRINLKIGLCLLLSSWLNAEEQVAKVPPLGASTLINLASPFSPGGYLALCNGVGAGTFLTKGQRKEQVGSSLTLNASLTLNNLYADKNLKVSAEQKMYFNWLEPEGVLVPASSFRWSDLIFRATVKDALFWSNGLSLTPTVELEAPISKLSRTAKRMIGLGTAFSLAWSSLGFTLSYKPHLAGYVNGSLALPSCEGSAKDCPPAVRQTRFMLKNTLAAKYRTGHHAFGITFRLYDAFLHPRAGAALLANGLAESNLSESTLGIIEYSYSIPSRFPVSLNFGVSSYQPSKNAAGAINFPFFDFKTPRDNNSEVYLEMELAFS